MVSQSANYSIRYQITANKLSNVTLRFLTLNFLL